MAEAVKRASFATEDMREGGGNFFGANGAQRGVIASGKFTNEPPTDTYAATGNPIFGVLNFDLGEDPENAGQRLTYSQSYSLGAQAGDHFAISADGQYLVPKDDDAQIVRDSKFGTLMQSLQREGVSKTILQNFSFDQLVGLVGMWKRVADKERSFSEERKAQRQGKYANRPQTTLILAKLEAMPEAKAAAPAKATQATAPAAAATTAAEPTGDIDDMAAEYVQQVLREKGGTIQRGNLTLKVSQAAKGLEASVRTQIAKRAGEEAFIVSLADAGIVTYDPAGKGQPVSLAA